VPDLVPTADLRNVALSAHAVLLIDAARQYGLIGGGPEINAERAEEIITQAARAGHRYSQEQIEQRAIELCIGFNDVAGEREGLAC
jgi:hypothetical protein